MTASRTNIETCPKCGGTLRVIAEKGALYFLFTGRGPGRVHGLISKRMGDLGRRGKGEPAQWSGRQGRSISTEGLRIIETFHAPGARVPQHDHEFPFATIVVRGGYLEKRRVHELRVPAGAIAIHGEGERHSDHFEHVPTHLLSIEWLSRPALVFSSRMIPRERAVMRICHALLGELDVQDSSSRTSIECLAAEVAVLSDSRLAPTPESIGWMRELEERLRSDFRNPLPLDLLASELGVHRSHLARTFRQRFGCTIGQFIRRLRISWARERLRRGAPISEVAIEAGFSDQSHMTRWFRRSIGATPGELTRN